MMLNGLERVLLVLFKKIISKNIVSPMAATVKTAFFASDLVPSVLVPLKPGCVFSSSPEDRGSGEDQRSIVSNISKN